MKILFIYTTRDAISPRHAIYELESIHIGLSYLAGYMKSQGHEIRLAVGSSSHPAASEKVVLSHVEEFAPDVVAFTSVTTQFNFVCALAKAIRQRSQAHLIAGGVHVSLNPESAMDRGVFDSICVGEGERPLGELAAQLSRGERPAGIANLWIKQEGGIIEKNPPRDFLYDLDSLPFPDRAMWLPWVTARQSRAQVVLPSRGCPFNCTYCCNHALRKIAGGTYVRFRSPANVEAEIRQLKDEYPDTRHVYLQSETILVKQAWLEEFCGLLAQYNATLPEKLEFTTNFRVAPNIVKEEIFALMSTANIRTIEIGLESGSERVRREVLNRRYSNEDFYTAVDLARRHGMKVNVYNMIGLPGETPAEHMETVEANLRVGPDRSYTSIFFPYPGTQLHTFCLSKGWLTADETGYTVERSRASLDFPEFSKTQIQRAKEWFEFRIYKGRKPLGFRMRKLVGAKIAGHPLLWRLSRALLPMWKLLHGQGR